MVAYCDVTPRRLCCAVPATRCRLVWSARGILRLAAAFCWLLITGFVVLCTADIIIVKPACFLPSRLSVLTLLTIVKQRAIMGGRVTGHCQNTRQYRRNNHTMRLVLRCKLIELCEYWPLSFKIKEKGSSLTFSSLCSIIGRVIALVSRKADKMWLCCRKTA